MTGIWPKIGVVFGEDLQFVFVMSAGGFGLAHFDICQRILYNP